VYQRRVRARLSPTRAAEIRAEDAEAHHTAYALATAEELNARVTARRGQRAQALAEDLPFLSQFESDPSSARAKFGDSSGATLFSARAAAASVSERDYVLEDDAMGPVSAAVQQDCMKAFLTVTDALVKMCAACGQQLIDASSFRPPQRRTDLSMLELQGEDLASLLLLPPFFRLRRCVYAHTAAGLTKYYHLHPAGVCSDGPLVVADVCTDCYSSLHRDPPRIPQYSIAAGYDFGTLHGDVLPELSVLEQTVIALSIRFMRVFKLSGGQLALQGHMIAFQHDSSHTLAEQLPRTDLSQCLRVAFVGDAAHYRALLDDPAARERLFVRFKTVLSVNAGSVFKWLHALRTINPYYRDLAFRTDAATAEALANLPTALLEGALQCTTDIAQRVDRQTSARLDGEDAPIGAVFVAPPVQPDRGDAQILAAVRSTVTAGAWASSRGASHLL